MQAVLPFSADKGFLSPDIRVDYDSPSVHPANPRTVGILLGASHVPGRRPDLSGTWLSESIVFAHEVFLLSAASSDPWISANADLCRVLAATEFVGKVFGGDLSPRVPSAVRVVVDRYHSVCRAEVRRQLGMFEPPERLSPTFSDAMSCLDVGRPVPRKLLPGRLSRLVSSFVSLFKVERGRPVLFSDGEEFVEDRDDAVFSVDLSPLAREGHAFVVSLRGGP